MALLVVSWWIKMSRFLWSVDSITLFRTRHLDSETLLSVSEGLWTFYTAEVYLYQIYLPVWSSCFGPDSKSYPIFKNPTQKEKEKMQPNFLTGILINHIWKKKNHVFFVHFKYILFKKGKPTITFFLHNDQGFLLSLSLSSVSYHYRKCYSTAFFNVSSLLNNFFRSAGHLYICTIWFFLFVFFLYIFCEVG